MNARKLSSLSLAAMLLAGITPQLCGQTPRGRRFGSRPPLDASGPGNAQGATPESRSGRPTFPAPPAGRPPIPRPTYSRLGESTTLATFPAFARCTVMPDAAYWHDRDYDIMALIQRQARKGFIPVTPFPVDQDTVMGTSMVASGWRVYGFVVPPGGQVQLKLSHPKPGWFRVYWVDQWGEVRPGMMVKPGEPEALYLNQGKKPMAVYAIVDDPGQWATTAANAYTLTAKRSFDAAHMDTGGVTVHQGIWNIAAESYWASAAHP